mgnify:CR=1 FL=1
MSRRPEHRRRTVRRGPAEEEVVAPEAPRPAAPGPQKKKPTRVQHARVDANALLAELDDLSASDLDALLLSAPRRTPRPGERVEGVLVRIEEGSAFVDIGGKSEGVIDPLDLDEDAQVGDRVSAFVLRAGAGGLVLATQIRGTADKAVLEEAYEAGLPVEGIVESKNTGGFVVKFGKTRGFCPISHIDRIVSPDVDYTGRRLQFRILEMSERGIVVSHRAIADEAAEATAEAVWERISEGDMVDGVVADVKPFGAFVDVDGLRALVPKRELGWGNAANPRIGSKVSARVIRVDREAGKLTLSMKDPGSGPWSRVGIDFVEGGVYPGTVARVRDFGAFVTLTPGLDGLVPVRHLSDQRVDHPSQVVNEGDTVNVRIMSIDSGNERMELSIRHAAGQAVDTVASTRTHRRSSGNASFGTFGDLLKGVKLKR